MDYRQTLNLPDQEFTIPMRAGLPQLEPQIQKRWEDMRLYERIQEKHKGAKRFILHDGPPYTNNALHIGTAMNRCLKDFIVRYRMMRGYDTPFVPGFDNHGMPIEQAIAKSFLDKGITPTKAELCRACREHAQRYIGLQTEQSKRLGEIGDWDRRYASMDPAQEALLVRAFGVLVEKGYVYRGLRPVTWCPVCTTALAEAEIEYDEHTSESIYVAFPLRDDPTDVLKQYKNVHGLIWTTTPWTIPANVAVAIGPELEYSLVEAGGKTYLIYKWLVDTSMSKCGTSDYKVVGEIVGRDLEGASFKHPIFDRPSVVVMVDYIREDEGTGLVHTAPGHGAEDFYTGKQYGLQVLCPVDAYGVFTDEAGEFAGLPIVPEGNKRVVERLTEEGTLLKYETYDHQYPHCWRCHTPLIFRATNQWFLSIDHDGLRDKMLSEIDNTKWFPDHSENRIRAMVETRPDWCLSRQRTWGIPIPAFYAPGDLEPLVDVGVINKVADLIAEKGIEGWYDAKPEDVLGEGFTYKGVPAAKLEKENDILDVWFDSGCTHYVVLDSGRWPELSWPSDLYIEGHDQHRGWFNTSLILGCALKGGAPYKAVVTHGFTLDENYRKMSKSLGNVLEPMDMVAKYGADIVRLWASNVSMFEDVAASDALIGQWADAFRRVRNTLRFLLANVCDFDESKTVPLREIDRWAIHRLNKTVADMTSSFEEYEFHRAWYELQLFCTQDLSAFYMDVTKDRMYCEAAGSEARRAGQTAYLRLASAICRAAAPILCHATEEVWAKLPLAEKTESVHLADFPSVDPGGLTPEEVRRWDAALKLRDEVNVKLEEAKGAGVLKDTQEALVELGLVADERENIGPLAGELATILKVSQVELHDGTHPPTVSLAPGLKCERCWLRKTDVGTDANHPTLCARCAGVVSGG